MPEKLYSVQEIMTVFLKAMRVGYAGSAEVTKGICHLPCSRVIDFEDGDFRVVDFWFVAPDSNYSFGQTIVFHNNLPVWEMSYQGWYSPEAVPFLKSVLRTVYESGIFFGGRGPSYVSAREPGLCYKNVTEAGSNFISFRGREEVRAMGDGGGVGDLLGEHSYQGLLLMYKK
ncbi:MAG: hypothetical protein WCX12_02310 [Candidatus Paceibacterota bacterium]|jgi:hypothetical protein